MKISNLSSDSFNTYLPNWQVKPAIVSALKAGLDRFLELLNFSNEPRIWRTIDGNGNTVWCVYDPVSDRSASLESEDEIRAWLEKRYYN